MNKVLVTGAGGLLGAHVVPLLAQSAEVVATGHSAPRVASANATALALDLSRPLDRSRLPERVDAVVYLAQSSRFRDFPDAADDIFAVNTARLVDMLDYARRAGAANFVYASTGGVYGGGGPEPLAEDAPAPPPGERLGFYPATKRAGELLAEAYAGELNIALLRYFFIYGAGQKRSMLIPRLVDSVREGRPIALSGDGLRCNPVHAEDAARATVAAAALDRSATINVAGPEVLSLREIGDAIGRRVGREPVYDVQPGAPRDLIADTARMAALLVPPSRRFEDGVGDLL